MKKIIVSISIVMAILSGLLGCSLLGQDIEVQHKQTEKDPVPALYQDEELGFSFETTNEFYRTIISETWTEEYDKSLGYNKIDSIFYGEVNGKRVPFFQISLYNGEFDAKYLRDFYPDKIHLGTVNGTTYVMEYTKENENNLTNEIDQKAYAEIMNTHVKEIDKHMEVKGCKEGMFGSVQVAIEQTTLEEEMVRLIEKNPQSLPITLTEKAHNVYEGTIGDKIVNLDIWVEEEQVSFYISMDGQEQYYEGNFFYDKTMIGAKTDAASFVFQKAAEESDDLQGVFSENGLQYKNAYFVAKHITKGRDKENRYFLGTNEEVEGFAKLVSDTIKAKDIAAFSQMISYPITLNLDGTKTTVKNQESFAELNATSVFTNEFITAFEATLPTFLFEKEAVMVGSGSQNVWVSRNKEGEFLIIGINN